MENGHKDVYILDLSSGKKVSAFSRTLGINWFSTQQQGDGTVSITAQLAFKTEKIPDAVAHLNQQEPERKPGDNVEQRVEVDSKKIPSSTKEEYAM